MNEIEQSESNEQPNNQRQLLELLVHGGKAVESQLDAQLASIGLSSAKWGVLQKLAEAGGYLTLGQLAVRLTCVKSNVTQLIDRLEAEQLVMRAPDPEDRRSIRATLTTKGEQAYESGLLVVSSFAHQLLDSLLPEERVLLGKLMVHMAGGKGSTD